MDTTQRRYHKITIFKAICQYVGCNSGCNRRLIYFNLPSFYGKFV